MIVFISILVFPNLNEFLKKTKFSIICFIFSFLILLCSLFNYPPTAGFFLLPIMIRILYIKNQKINHIKESFYTLGFFFITCLCYFIIHKIYIEYYGQKLPLSSLYRFDLASNLFINFYEFFVVILPVMFNLWNPAPNFIVSSGILLFVIWLLRTKINLNLFKINSTNILILIFISMFFAVNAPGLLASGTPPTFYRSWHPGMAVCLLIVFWSVHFSLSKNKIKVIFSLFFIVATLFSFNSSNYLSIILSNQFKYSISQIKAQINKNVSRFVIIEKRPDNKILSFERWGELGFVHVLSRGHGIYILDKIFNIKVHREIENIVLFPKNNKFILEKDLINERQDLYKFVNNNNINKLIDNRLDTFYESNNHSTGVLFESIHPNSLYCYKVYSDVFEPKLMPKKWELYGSNNKKKWELIHINESIKPWNKGEARTFNVNNESSFKFYKFKFNNSNVRIGEIRFFGKEQSCANDFVNVSDINKKLLKSFSLNDPKGNKIKFSGLSQTQNLSDFPFRLQRSLDNIYYTFWETLAFFPINADFLLFEAEKIKCYRITSGDDKANHRMPSKWDLLGSNDNKQWELIDSRENEKNWTNSSTRKYQVRSPNLYKYYKFNFLEVDGGNFFRIYELDLSNNADCSKSFP